jgi:nucleoside-diphosphate-sugar epimerase
MIKDRLLILGASGNLGSYLTEELMEFQSFYDISIPSRSECDLLNDIDTVQYFKASNPTIVIFLAASVLSFTESKSHIDIFEENTMMGINVIKGLKFTNCKRIIYASSASIYSECSSISRPYKEKSMKMGSPEKAHFGYALAKRSIGELLFSLSNQDLTVCILIFTNLYDFKGIKSKHVIPTWIYLFKEAVTLGAKSVSLNGNPETIRDFLHFKDAAKALILSLKSSYSGFYNVGSNYPISLRELANQISKKLKFNGEINWKSDMDSGNPNKSLNSTLFYEKFKFNKSTSFLVE